MRLAILGATGRTGIVLLAQALAAGNEVTALVRNAGGLAVQSPRLQIVAGSVLSPQDLEKVVDGQDAVLSALGAKTLGETTIYSEPIRLTVEAMRKHSTKRLVCISSGGLEKSDPAFGFFYKVFVKGMLLRNSYADMARMEGFLRSVRDIEWVVVRPTVLTDGPMTGQYRVSTRLCPPGKGPKISRQDVAQFMLQQVSASVYVHQTPTLAY